MLNMSKAKKDTTFYEKSVQWLKNQKIIAFLLIFFVILLGLSQTIDAVEKVRNFFSLNKPKPDSNPHSQERIPPIKADSLSAIVGKPKHKKKEREIEISIQINGKSGEYKKVFLNNIEVIPLPSSTRFNPRILVPTVNKNSHNVIIVTTSGDTCYVAPVFDTANLSDKTYRYLAKCSQ